MKRTLHLIKVNKKGLITGGIFCELIMLTEEEYKDLEGRKNIIIYKLEELIE